MGKSNGGEKCIRKCIVIGGQNFYLIVGSTFVDCTVPHENRPENMQLREIVDTLCEEISTIMESKHGNSVG